MSDIKRGVSKFQLVGKVKINDKTFTLNQKGKNNKDYIFNQLNLGVSCSGDDTNIVYATMMGGYDAIKETNIYCHGLKDDGDRKIDDYENRITIPFKDRFVERDDIANSCYITIGIVKDINGKVVEKRFLSQYDAINYLKENLVNDTVVSIRGNIRYHSYQGNTQVEKNITSIWVSSAETKDFKASFEQTVLFTQDGFNESVDKEGYLSLYGYVVDYYNKDIGNVCYPYTISINTNVMPKYEVIIKNYLRPKTANGVNKVSLEGRWARTDNTTEVTYEDLSSDLKDMVDVGLITKEEALGRAIGTARSETKTTLKSICTRKNTETGIISLLIDTDNVKLEDIADAKVPEYKEEGKVLNEVASEVKKTTGSENEINESLLNDLFGD